jgi:hypothetical protein
MTPPAKCGGVRVRRPARLLPKIVRPIVLPQTAAKAIPSMHDARRRLLPFRGTDYALTGGHRGNAPPEGARCQFRKTGGCAHDVHMPAVQDSP